MGVAFLVVLIAFVVALVWGMAQREMKCAWRQSCADWQRRATNAERQLPAFKNWPDLTDPAMTQIARMFDVQSPSEQ